MPSKKDLRRRAARRETGDGPVKEACRLIRLARKHWDAHQNAACRRERTRAIEQYEGLNADQREKVPQELRVWLRYRSEKYFGDDRTPPGKSGS